MASTAVEASSQRRILEFWKLQRKDKVRLREDVETLFAAVSEGMQTFPTPSDADYTILFKVVFSPFAPPCDPALLHACFLQPTLLLVYLLLHTQI